VKIIYNVDSTPDKTVIQVKISLPNSFCLGIFCTGHPRSDEVKESRGIGSVIPLEDVLLDIRFARGDESRVITSHHNPRRVFATDPVPEKRSRALWIFFGGQLFTTSAGIWV